MRITKIVSLSLGLPVDLMMYTMFCRIFYFFYTQNELRKSTLRTTFITEAQTKGKNLNTKAITKRRTFI